MRTNEPTESQPWRPLGEKVQKPTPAPQPKPAPMGTGPSGIVVDKDGRMKTTNHKA